MFQSSWHDRGFVNGFHLTLGSSSSSLIVSFSSQLRSFNTAALSLQSDTAADGSSTSIIYYVNLVGDWKNQIKPCGLLLWPLLILSVHIFLVTLCLNPLITLAFLRMIWTCNKWCKMWSEADIRTSLSIQYLSLTVTSWRHILQAYLYNSVFF